MALLFKKCTIVDLDALINISRNTFIDAFEKDNDPVDFKAYIKKAFEKSNIQQQLENIDSSFYFVYSDDALVGYFKLNVNTAQTDIKTAESIELERIYVLSEFQGKQFGKQILQKAIRIASKNQKAFIWLGVWENNRDAIRFYLKHGFVKFGAHPYYIGEDEQTDWLLRFDLTNFQKL